MVMYDITSERSFDNVQNWIRNIGQVRVMSMVFLLF